MKTIWLVTRNVFDYSGSKDHYRIQKTTLDKAYDSLLSESEGLLGYSFFAAVPNLVDATCLISGLIAIATGRFLNTVEHIKDFHHFVKLINIEDYK